LQISITGKVEPFKKTWDLNADNSFVTNNTGNSSEYWNQFAEGEPDYYGVFYPKTLFDRIMLKVYKQVDKKVGGLQKVIGVSLNKMKL